MKAWELSDGRIVIPRRADQDGFVGEGLDVVEANSIDAIEWKPWTVPATPEIEQRFAKKEPPK